MMVRLRSPRSGQMLVELMLAMAMAAMVLIALVSLSTRSLSTTNFSKKKSEANSYAMDGMEWIRDQRGTLGWSVWYAAPACGPICGDIGNGYTRTATFTNGGGSPQSVTVTVAVSWAEAGKTFSAGQSAVFNQY